MIVVTEMFLGELLGYKLPIESIKVNWTTQKYEKRRNWCPGIEAWGIYSLTA